MYHEPGLSLSYANGGLDGFGRVVNHAWMKNADPTVHIIHSYDYNGNRLTRHDAVSPDNSETYSYDQTNQITSLNRDSFSESWSYDKTGNWMSYNKNGNTETRTHNAANEIQGIATHDKNGNMTVLPGTKTKYDAWNRLVEVRNDNDELVASYEYNGLNQRAKKVVGNVVTTSFFNENWQELGSVTGGVATSYVWGLRYVDDLVMRERGQEKLFSLQDANWNVVAVADSSGAVQERYVYDGFGKRTALLDSDIDFDRAFTGQVLDAETGLMLYRNRYYSTELGRFVSRDPIGYEAGDQNVYRYVGNGAMNFVDELGLMIILTPRPIFLPRPINPRPTFPRPNPSTYPRPLPKPPVNTPKPQPNPRPNPNPVPVPGPMPWPNPDGPGVPPQKPPCPDPPGDCSKQRHGELNNAVRKACRSNNVKRACEYGMSYEQLLENLRKNEECVKARDTLNNECFRGGNEGHLQQLNNDNAAIQKCRKIIGETMGL